MIKTTCKKKLAESTIAKSPIAMKGSVGTGIPFVPRIEPRTFTARLVQAREEERTRISRELHDELGQILTSMNIEIGLMARRMSKYSHTFAQQSEPCVDNILGLVQEAIASVKHMAKTLRPPTLEESNLADAVSRMVQGFQERTQIACTFMNSAATGDYDPAFSTAVYRIVQESLTNVARHAEASAVWIQMKAVNGMLFVTVADNGIGIQADVLNGDQSFGLLGMHERAYSFDGEIHITGKPGQGTTVALAVPIRKVDF